MDEIGGVRLIRIGFALRLNMCCRSVGTGEWRVRFMMRSGRLAALSAGLLSRVIHSLEVLYALSPCGTVDGPRSWATPAVLIW